MDEVLTVWDLLLAPFYFTFIILISFFIKSRNVDRDPAYKYYVPAILAKLVGATSLCLIYVYYYHSAGDTINYFKSAVAMLNMYCKHPSVFLDCLLGDYNSTGFSYFDASTGYPVFYGQAYESFASVLFVPLTFLGCKSYLATSLLITWVSFSGIWKLYLLFNSYFPSLYEKFAISILFVPSVVFWGSGMLKDSIIIAAIGWFVFVFHELFIKKKFNVRLFFLVVLNAWLIIKIKPYVFFALLPGSMVWLGKTYSSKIENTVFRVVMTPFLILVFGSISYMFLKNIGNSLGKYSLDKVFMQASIVQNDLKQSYYGGNSYDIGNFDGSFQGALLKAPQAIFAGLFRPTLLDIRNVFMSLAALENTYMLLLTVFLLIKLKFLGFFFYVPKNPLLLFSVLFSLFFAFSVGLSTANFGALVRLRIPCLPFFVSSLFIMKYYYDLKEKEGKVILKKAFKLNTVQS